MTVAKKRRTALQKMLHHVEVQSLAGGDMAVRVTWNPEFAKPGVVTRLYAARSLERFLNGYLRQGRRSS